MKKAFILWFTGLSGSGKTSIANIVHEELKKIGKKVMVIDGDVIRATLHKELGFTPAHIRENNRLIASMCHDNLEKYDFILVPIISPFRQSRDFARKLLFSCFIEVYVNASIDECIRRDVKGLYRKALAGLIDNFIGIDANVPYEAPDNPEIIIDAELQDPMASAKSVLDYISKRIDN